MHEPILVIMAAGMGSRFGGLKQITPISGDDEVILDFSLYDAMLAGFKKAVIIIKEENREDFRRLVDEKAGKHMQIEYVYQKLENLPAGFGVPEGRVKPWGTAHAVLCAKDKIDDNFVVINADDYYGPGAFQTIYDFLEKVEDTTDANGVGVASYAMVGYKVENTLTENGHVSRGVCVEDSKGNLAKIDERTKIMWKGDKIAYEVDGAGANDANWVEVTKGTTVSMNFWGFTPSYLDALSAQFPEFLKGLGLGKNVKKGDENSQAMGDPLKAEFQLPKTVDTLIKSGKATVKVLKSQDRWYGVTYKEDKDTVVNALQSLKDNGIYPEKLWK